MNPDTPADTTEEPEQPDRSFHLKHHEKPGEGIRRVALGRADSALEGLRGLGSADDEAATIHGVRKDLKKLRSTVRMVRNELGEKKFKKLNRLLGDAGRELSSSRDAQIKVETLDSMTSDHAEARLACSQWRVDLLAEERKSEAHTGSGEMAALDDAIAKVEEARESIAKWSFKPGADELIDEGLVVSYRKGRMAMKAARADTTPENMHEWRKRAKDLWYQLRIIRKAWPDLIGGMSDMADELTDLLGDHHDFVVLAEDLKGREMADADRKTLEAAIEEFQNELAEDAFELGGRVYAEKPKELRKRMRRYWKVWRRS